MKTLSITQWPDFVKLLYLKFHCVLKFSALPLEQPLGKLL